jgi:predicted NBD/HSP70 family sugar kinase
VDRGGEESLKPALEPGFEAAAAWNREYRDRVARAGGDPLVIEIRRGGRTVGRREETVLKPGDDRRADNGRFVERIAKFMLWQAGGDGVTVEGSAPLGELLERAYSPSGARGFDRAFFDDVYGGGAGGDEPASLGGHRDGCRIGFDLGASDRKCAALVDGEIVHSEEVPWDPASFSDPREHYEGILDSLRRAAAHLPRVDAIGGSVAGVFGRGGLMVSSLFRGMPAGLLRASWPKMVRELREAFGGVPFAAANDGAVAALAGAEEFGGLRVLGLALGSSLAAGYVGDDGGISPRIDELAFAPIDYAPDAPADEWSGDRGCAVQYLSQQGTARFMDRVGLRHAPEAALRERLLRLQEAAAAGDERANRVYETVGACLAHAIAHFADFYALRHVLLYGRVLTGPGGETVAATARKALAAAYPDLAGLKLHVPDERQRRHGQAAAAATLPPLGADA